MNLQLEAMAVAMPHVAGHPNRLPFHGVLTLVGVASQRSPTGAHGHRVLLTRAATESALPSLLGMALDYAPSLDVHDARRKIGIITEANIVAMPQSKTSSTTGQVAVSGYLFAHDFPEVVKEIQAQPGSTLGMSYEIANVTVPIQETPIWAVTNFTFTGAALLRRIKLPIPRLGYRCRPPLDDGDQPGNRQRIGARVHRQKVSRRRRRSATPILAVC